MGDVFWVILFFYYVLSSILTKIITLFFLKNLLPIFYLIFYNILVLSMINKFFKYT